MTSVGKRKIVRNGVSWKAKRDGWSRIFCDARISEVLTSTDSQGEVGKREAVLVSVENMEEVGRVTISLTYFWI